MCRNILRFSVFLIGISSLWLPGLAAEAQPNIVLIYADDLGYGDVACYGAQDARTPNLDRLATGGVRFTDGYVSAPICAASRAGLMTGRYQQRFGYYNNVESTEVGLPHTEFNLAQLLRKEGYATGLVGKWHLGSVPSRHPTEMGFTEFYGFLGGSHDYYDLAIPPVDANKSEFQRRLRGSYRGRLPSHQPLYRGTEPISEEGYLTDLLQREAVSFIERQVAKDKNRPFFLYLAFNAPHFPQQAPASEIEKFKTGKPLRDVYLAMVAIMDRAVGAVLDQLDTAGVADNTLVFFISDNGGLERTHNRPPERISGASNGVLRGEKGELYEGGIRVPFIVRWPGKIPAGKVVAESVINLDVLPTCMAAAGGELPGDRTYDGRNLIPFLTSQMPIPPHAYLVWTMDPDKKYAVRQGKWKLLYEDDEINLYNLERDIGEKRNLAGSNTRKARDLYAFYQRLRREMRDSIAGPKRYWGKR